MITMKWIVVVCVMALMMAYGCSAAANGLVRVADVDPSLVVELRYASANNFTGRRVYPQDICLLREETARRLAAANQEFSRQGYRIKVWDAYRPLAVQKIFWQLVPDENFVAPPARGSRHNRGGAVDITLVDVAGAELEMPSAFDDFSPRAFRDNREMSAAARRNMEYLTRVMVDNGFRPISSEWWHFEDRDAVDFPLLDVPLEQFMTTPPVLSRLAPAHRQALVVRERATTGPLAWVSGWERAANGWRPVIQETEAVIGKAGFAPLGEKREGDSKTPRGHFCTGAGFWLSGYGNHRATVSASYRRRLLGG